MKKTIIILLALGALTACVKENEWGDYDGKGIFYASVDGGNEVFELFPGRSKTFDLRARAEARPSTSGLVPIPTKAAECPTRF